MEKSVYMVSVTLAFFVRASSETSAGQLAYDLMISRGDKLSGHTNKLEVMDMERPPDGSARIPWEGEVDAVEA